MFTIILLITINIKLVILMKDWHFHVNYLYHCETTNVLNSCYTIAESSNNVVNKAIFKNSMFV